MSEYDGLINEFCWDYLDYIRKGCSPFDQRFNKEDGLCQNAIWWYYQKFHMYGSGSMRDAMGEIFLNEFGNRSYPFNKGGADFHNEQDLTKNPKRIAWAMQRAVLHKPLPLDPLEDTTLHDADPSCDHQLINRKEGGIKCIKCSGWFCF